MYGVDIRDGKVREACKTLALACDPDSRCPLTPPRPGLSAYLVPGPPVALLSCHPTWDQVRYSLGETTTILSRNEIRFCHKVWGVCSVWCVILGLLNRINVEKNTKHNPLLCLPPWNILMHKIINTKLLKNPSDKVQTYLKPRISTGNRQCSDIKCSTHYFRNTKMSRNIPSIIFLDLDTFTSLSCGGRPSY